VTKIKREVFGYYGIFGIIVLAGIIVLPAQHKPPVESVQASEPAAKYFGNDTHTIGSSQFYSVRRHVFNREATGQSSLSLQWHFVICAVGGAAGAAAMPTCPDTVVTDWSRDHNLLHEVINYGISAKEYPDPRRPGPNDANGDEIFLGLSNKYETICSIKRGDKLPWIGECINNYFWSNGVGSSFDAIPTCTIKTSEIITSVTATEITGRNQTIDISPVRKMPAECPVPSSTYSDFTLTSESRS
jgi:hypothetical protein